MEPKHIILVIIILFIFQKLINLKKLKSELIKKNLEIEQLQEEKLQNRQKNNYPKRESGIEDQLLTSPDEFYYLKSSCMNRNESRMFYYINCALNEFLSPDQRKNYSVFPQVSLYAFIGISSNVEGDFAKSRIAGQNIRAKSVDYVICRRVKDKASSYYLYKPVVIIELDGSSHHLPTYGQKALEKQQARDKFKDSLFDSLGIPLLRYRIDDTDNVVREDRLKIKQTLQKYLLS